MIGGLTIATWVLLALPALAIVISIAGWLRAAR
jgi:cytochrome c-type biogenesis protein CcmH/NrfF